MILSQRLREILSSLSSVKVMVIGDLMLDEYLWGRVERISPEAPVPVVEIESESIGLGGAANVAHNISALGAVAIPVGVIGQDPAGEKLLMEMNRLGITTQGIVVDPSRQTTLKTRVIAHHQHVVRTDRETKRPISQDMARRIVNFVKEGIDQVDALLLEDYNKGVITKQLLGQVIPLAVERGKLCTADPKFDNFFDFKGVTVFKPNLREVEAAFGIRIGPKEDLPALGRKLLQRLGCKYVLFTQGADGMSLFEGDGVVSHVPAVAREVFDVSGAGDTVIATLTVAMAAGAEIMEAVELANHAAGMVVGQVGVVPVTKEMIEESLTRS